MQQSDDDFISRTTTRVIATADRMTENVADLTHRLHDELIDAIAELRGDAAILELLDASIEGNLKTISQVVRYDMQVAEITAPPTAVEYARRLAQRGVSSSALLRAYRLGQETATAWSLERISEEEPDPRVAYAAGQAFVAITFRYIDAVSEQVLNVYEGERERWLANRNTVRAEVLTDLLGADPVAELHGDVTTAENALGYRLRQTHVGVVLWSTGETGGGDLHGLERLLGRVARALGSSQQPLFAAQDRATAWGWIPLGTRSKAVADPAALTDLDVTGIRLALGVPAPGVEGFRSSHLDALQAQTVALVAGDRARAVTAYGDPEVRAAALLCADLEATRRLVRTALGALAEESESAERLRETLRVFLSTRNSFAATAELVHLHKNTVKYRVDRAVELRGRGVDEDRLDLELALIACRWLGTAALVSQANPAR
ncbi:MAG: PucR family transcriptional regulator [Marmoricola sp.]